MLKNDFASYLEQMTEDENLLTTILNLNQPVLRAAIYGCYTQCLQENIEFSFSSTSLLPSFKDYNWYKYLRILQVMQLSKL